MTFEEQVVSIYAGVKGHLDKINVKDVSRFESELLRKIKSGHQDLLEKIRTEQKISDHSEAELKKIIEEFLDIFDGKS